MIFLFNQQTGAQYHVNYCYYGLSCITPPPPPQNVCAPAAVNVFLFGSRVFADVIKLTSGYAG